MLDAITLEKRGIPAVAVVTEPFVPTGNAMAELNGLPGYPFVVVPHPFGSLDDASVRARADAALERIERLLLGG
ncbi:MAG TPA: hypothetical protein VMT79_10950 [Candidatus Binatia bacterium]|nr:hypothetical protein [Candidatus Binatia bacterium]